MEGVTWRESREAEESSEGCGERIMRGSRAWQPHEALQVHGLSGPTANACEAIPALAMAASLLCRRQAE